MTRIYQRRKSLWNLGKNSAGLYIRFKAEGSIALYFRWKPTLDNSMEHMADTGTKGLDLYALSDEFGWRYLRCARPKGSGTYEAKLICGKPAKEYMLYLPLYDGIASLKIGVEKGGFIGQPEIMSPNNVKPVIMYGSSILQGCSANRPGMAHTNILARMLDREVINLGFSGNAKIDYEIAELMASHKDPGVFVLDYVPNCTADMIDEKAELFFYIADHLSVSCLCRHASEYMSEKLSYVSFLFATGRKEEAAAEFSAYNTQMRRCLDMLCDTSVPLFAEMSKWVKKFSLCCDLLDAIYAVMISPEQSNKQSLADLLEKYNSDAVVLTGFCLREAAEKALKM